MITVACKVYLLIEGSYSLKDKRRVVKSLIEKLKSRFNVSVAQIDVDDIWNSAVIGISCVSNKEIYLDNLIQSLFDFIENDQRVQITKYYTETIYIKD